MDKPGVKRSASFFQFETTDSGQAMRTGARTPASRSLKIKASAWMVLPRPMSSARQAPRPYWRRNESHEKPRT